MSGMEMWTSIGLLVAMALLLVSLVLLRQARRELRELRAANEKVIKMMHNVTVTHSEIRFAIMDMLEDK